MFDAILKIEIEQIVWLQNVCQPIEAVLHLLSTKSTALNLYVLSICLAFDVKLFVVLQLVTCFAGYTSNILKWQLADSRPYWWVAQTDAYGALTRPTLRQTDITCETSPGNPSGHVMLNAAYWFVLLQRLSDSPEVTARLEPLMQHHKSWLRPLGWTVYAGIVAVMSVSRMYFACHFMHQCVLGAALGYGMSRYLTQPNSGVLKRLLDGSRLWLSMLGAGMIGVALVTYFGQMMLQRDPLWSIRTAFNWCENPLFVRPETTSTYCIVRDMGTFFGLVLAAPLTSRFQDRLDVRYSLPAVSAIVIAHSMLSGQIPRQHGVHLFYASTFLLNMSLVFGLITAVTKLCKVR